MKTELLTLAAVLAALPVFAQVTETHSFTSLNRAIPDGNPSGLGEFRTVNSSIAAISQVRVKLRLAGEYNGDLYAYLAHDSGFSVLLNRPGRTAVNPGGYDDSGMDVTFDVAAANGDIHVYRNVIAPAAGLPLTGTWQPDGRAVDPNTVTDLSARTAMLGSFAGLNGDGDWVLFVADLESGGTNQLVGWELEISGRATPVVTWAEPADIIYGAALGAGQLNATVSVPGTLAYSPVGGAVLNAGANQLLTVIFTPTDLVSYSSVTQAVNLDVAKAPLLVTADDKSKVYGAVLPTLTATYTGFVNGDTEASLDTPVQLSTTATASSPAGSYSITASGAADANYAIAFTAGTLTVTKASSIGIVAVSANPAAPGQPATLTMSLGAVAPGAGTPTGTVQFLADGSPFGVPVPVTNGVASMTTAVLTLGTHTITADYGGDGNFESTSAALGAPLVINTLPVAAADVIERFPGLSVKVQIATLLSNDSDADSDTLSFHAVSSTSTAGGLVTVTGAWVRYTPPAGQPAGDSFTYTVADGRGGLATGTVTVQLANDTNVTENVLIQALGNGSFRVRFHGIPGVDYAVQFSADLNPPAWTTLSTVTTDGQGYGEVIDTPPGGTGSRYYRTAR